MRTAGETPGDADSPRGRAWWRRVLGEVLALLVVVVTAEYLFNDGRIGSLGVHPHPYWLVVLPMAALRGTVAGLVTAILASAMYSWGAMRALGRIDLPWLLELERMKEPVLFFAVGFFVGEARDYLASRTQRLREELRDLAIHCERLACERGVLGRANRELEARLVHHTGQFSNLVTVATRLENASEEEIYEIALDLVEEHCGAIASVLMVLDQNMVDLCSHRGWADAEIGRRLAAARVSSLVGRAIDSGLAVNGFHQDARDTGRGPLVVAPLIDAHRVVRALLCLDHLPAARLNQANIATFLGIAEWISAALSRRTASLADVAPRVVLPVPPKSAPTIGNGEELGERLQIEYDRCARYGVPTSVMAVYADHPAGDVLIEPILTDFAESLRVSDVLLRFGFPGCYVWVLAGTPVDGAHVVRKRLLHRLDVSPAAAQLNRLAALATSYDAEAADVASLLERLTDWFRGHSRMAVEGACPVSLREHHELGDASVLLRRLEVEIDLARRLSFDLQVVGLCGERRDDASAGTLARQLGALKSSILRKADQAFAVGPHHAALVLPSTSKEQAVLVARRVEDALAARDPAPPHGQLLTFITALSPATHDAASFLAVVRALPTIEVNAPDVNAPEVNAREVTA